MDAEPRIQEAGTETQDPTISGVTLIGRDDVNSHPNLRMRSRIEEEHEPRDTASSIDTTSQKDIEKAIITRNERTPFVLPEEYGLVEFDGPDDPGNPKNWSASRRWVITVAGGLLTFGVTFSSSIFSVAINPVSEEFHVSREVAILGVSLFLLGFVFGPVIFGPASEAYGRRWPLLIGFTIFAIFQIPVAVAQNVETIMLGRFFSGFAASAPLAVTGGLLSDLWDPINRAYGICILASGGFAGPAIAPVVGAFITQSSLGWRWTAWITLILAAPLGIFGFVAIPETSAPKILQARAREMRYQTKNWALHAKADENRLDANTILNVYLTRPFIMIVQEPILACVTAYMSFIYGILYLFFEAYPISFQEDRGWSLGVSSLPFLSFSVGIAAGAAGIAYSTRTNFRKALEKHGRPIPEERLPPTMFGAIILPIGLFWFGWTSNPHVTWVPQVLSSALLGGGCLVTFWQSMNYLTIVTDFTPTVLSPSTLLSDL